MGPMFIHDFAEVRGAPAEVVAGMTVLPELLGGLVGPAFDQTVSAGAAPWPVSYGQPRRRDDGWVYPLWWPAGRGGLVPAVEADLGVFPATSGICHLEIMGTYRPSPRRQHPDHSRREHLRTVMGIRRILQALAAGLGHVEPIPVGPVRSGRHR